jgi:RNA polymerase sigma-70 factor (ECF subfamily)
MKSTRRLNQSDLGCDNMSETSTTAANAIPDSVLMSGVAGGDECAFADLYHRYSTPIYHYLCTLVIDGSAAEEILQDVFLAVWNGARRFRGESQVKTWIFHIAHNQAVSWFRKSHRALHLDDPERASGEPDLEARTIDRWRDGQIREALNRLSPPHREVVELAFFHELSYQEIAIVMGCPVGTVKSRMSYARRSMTHVLKELGLDPSQA